MKYVLYGLGAAAPRIIHLLGEESILAFIDKAKCGSVAFSKPVIAYSQLHNYLSEINESDVTIVVSSTNYQQEISRILRDGGDKFITCQDLLGDMGRKIYGKLHKLGFLCVFEQGIGDLSLTCAFLPAYFHENNVEAKKIAVCTANRKEISALFPIFDAVCILEDYELLALTMYLSDKDFLAYQAINTIFMNPKFFRRLQDMNMTNALMNKTCYLLYLGLASESPCLRPVVKKESDILPYVKRYGLVKGKTVFLIPEANTCKTFSREFWLKLARELHTMGYGVCFNCSADYGTDGFPSLLPSLSDMSAIVNYCGGCISIQCGLSDLLVFSGCKVTVLYIKDETRDKAYNPIYRETDDYYYTNSYVLAESPAEGEQVLPQALNKIMLQISQAREKS